MQCNHFYPNSASVQSTVPTWGKSAQGLVTRAHRLELSHSISGREAFLFRVNVICYISSFRCLFFHIIHVYCQQALKTGGGALSAIWRTWWEKCSTCNSEFSLLSNRLYLLSPPSRPPSSSSAPHAGSTVSFVSPVHTQCTLFFLVFQVMLCTGRWLVYILMGRPVEGIKKNMPHASPLCTSMLPDVMLLHQCARRCFTSGATLSMEMQ